MTEDQKEMTLEKISEILAENGIYIAFRAPEIYLKIAYNDEFVVDEFGGSAGIELGKTDLVTEY